MENHNILVFLSVVHVLLNFYSTTIQGKIFSRNLHQNHQPILVHSEKQLIEVLSSRKRRDLSDSDFDTQTEKSASQNISKLSSSVFKIPDRLHSQAVVHWSGKNGKVVFVLTRQTKNGFVTDSTLWRSEDYGTSFNKVELPLDAVVEFIYLSNVKRNQLILTDILNRRVYTTRDEGITWTSSEELGFEPDNLLLHPTESEWVLGYTVMEMALYVSGDFGKTWKLLHESVSHRYYWAVENVDKNNLTVHMELQDLYMLGPSEYLACVAPDCIDVTPDKGIGDIDPFSMIVQNEYVFVQKSTLQSTAMFVSYNRGPFRKAYFPLDLHPTDFHIVDTTEHQVFIAADHKESVVNLYLSDTNGQFYVPTLRNVVSTIEDPWLDVDLYNVKGIQGTYIANQYVDLKDGRIVEKTFISYDKGGTWSLINVPSELLYLCDDSTNCHLHLHMRYSKLTFNIPDIETEEEAPGLILAHGYVGEQVKKDAHLFISNDGGLNWKRAPFDGQYKVNILDQGGAIIAIEHNSTRLNNVVHFSCDEGNTWKTYQFSEDKMYVDGVLNEPGISTLIVSVFGRLEDMQSRQMVKLNFSSLLSGKCQDTDYITWTPTNKVTNKSCILGQVFQYLRRKTNALCYNGPDFKPMTPKSACLCTPDDYECDYGYEPEDINRHVCQQATWYDDSKINHHCVEGETFVRSQGYRKIASNKCVGGVENYGKYQSLNISCPVYRPEGLSLKIERKVIATGANAVFTLSQVKGSTHSTVYTWDFGDNTQPVIDLGLDKTKVKSHIYKKAGTYKVQVFGRNSVGVESCTMTIKIEDEITNLNIQIPRGAQINHPAIIIANALGKNHTSDFGLVHYVWNFGDQFQANGSRPHLTWSNTASYTYTTVSKYNISVEAVNSVSTITKYYILQVHKNVTTLRLMFSSNIDHFNTKTLLWRLSFASIICMNLAELLYVDRSRVNVYILNQKPTVADVTILPSYIGGITISQIVMELQDKLDRGLLKFTWMPNEEPVTVTGIDLLSDNDNVIGFPETTTITPLSTTKVSSPSPTSEQSRSTSPILIAVPLVIVVFIILVILAYFCRRRFKGNSKPGQPYSLILNRNRGDTSCANDDDDFLTIEDYDIHDGDTNIVINPDFQSAPSLEFMSFGTRDSNDSANC